MYSSYLLGKIYPKELEKVCMKTKKVIAVLLSLGMLFSLAACTVREKKSEPVESNPSETSSRAADNRYASYDIGETGRDGSIEMCVDAVELVTWEQVDWSGVVYDTHNLIKAHVSITNLGDEDLTFKPSDIRCYIDNEELMVTRTTQAYDTVGIGGDLIENATIHSGRSETGWILYEYYRDWNEFELQYLDTSLDFTMNFNKNDVQEVQSLIDIPEGSGTDVSTTTPTESGTTTETSASGGGLTIPVTTAETTAATEGGTTQSSGGGLTIPPVG